MEVVHELTMHLDDRRLVPCVDAVQCDANTRVLELTLLSGDVAWAVPSGMSVAVAFRKSDGTAGLYDVLPDGTKACSYSGNVVRAVLAPQVLTAWGLVEVAVVIQDPSTLDRVATFPLCVEVARDPAAGKGISNDYYRCTSLGDVNGILDGFDQELEEFRGSIRPFAWSVTTANMEIYGWSTFLDLPTAQFYRLSAEVPASFGLPVPGSAGTLVAFDASNYDAGAEWYVVYICTQLVKTEDQVYIAYAKPSNGLEAVVWRRIEDVTDMKAQVAQLENQVTELDKSIRPYEWAVTSANMENFGWDTFLDLPTSQFYRFDTSVPASFGLPVAERNGTIVAFDASSSTKSWYTIYICSILASSTESKHYITYANKDASLSDVVWKEIATDPGALASLSGQVSMLSTQVSALEAENDETVEQVAALQTSIRPWEWAVTSTSMKTYGWSTFLDLPTERFYRFNTSVPGSFGLPVTGKNGTLVAFDASNASTNWFVMYICAVLMSSTEQKYYVTYANKTASLSDVVWKEIVTDREQLLQDAMDSASGQFIEGLSGSVFGVDRPKIVLLGDSIMAGVGASDYDASGELVIDKTFTNGPTYEVYRDVGAKSWAAQFKAHMESTYPGCSVINNGVPGFTTWQLSDSMDELVPEDVDIAIVQIGTNSRNAADKTTLIIDPMKAIIDYLREMGVTPIVMTNTVLLDQTAPNDAQNVRQCIMEACAEKGVYCYDVLGEMEWYLTEHGIESGSIMADDLHPKDLGHELIYRLYRKLLRV